MFVLPWEIHAKESTAKPRYLQVHEDQILVVTDAPENGRIIYRAEPGEILRATTSESATHILIDGIRATNKISTPESESLRGLFIPKNHDKAAVYHKNLAHKDMRNGFPEVKGYIDLPDGKVTTVFKEPGKSWRDCQADPNRCGSVGWPHNNSDIRILDSRLVEIEDPLTQERRYQNYYFVRYRYQTKQGETRTGEGWISSEFIATKPVKVGRGMDPMCRPIQAPAIDSKADLRELKKPIDELVHKNNVEALLPLTGKCLLENPKEAPVFSKGETPYGVYLKNHLNGMKPRKLPDGRTVSAAQLMAIDTFARTLYGEMAVCWEQGTHYMKAVAAVVKNRERFAIKNPVLRTLFVESKDDLKPENALIEVLMKPSQFSVWNVGSATTPNGNLRHVLCPPSSREKTFWLGGKPSEKELAIWKDAVSIAADAVLNEDDFRKETTSVSQYFYTSGRGRFYDGFEIQSAQIDGMELSRRKCIELWEKEGYP